MFQLHSPSFFWSNNAVNAVSTGIAAILSLLLTLTGKIVDRYIYYTRFQN